jgi:hypothetical protein
LNLAFCVGGIISVHRDIQNATIGFVAWVYLSQYRIDSFGKILASSRNAEQDQVLRTFVSFENFMSNALKGPINVGRIEYDALLHLQSFFASQDEFKGGFVEKYTAIRELGDL